MNPSERALHQGNNIGRPSRTPSVVYEHEGRNWRLFLNNGYAARAPIRPGEIDFDQLVAHMGTCSNTRQMSGRDFNRAHRSLTEVIVGNWGHLSEMLIVGDRVSLYRAIAFPEVELLTGKKSPPRPDVMGVDCRGHVWVGEVGTEDKSEKLDEYRDMVGDLLPHVCVQGFIATYVTDKFYRGARNLRIDVRYSS